MGNYNPDIPFVLGNEFAGIRNVDLELPINADSVEYGVQFTTSANRIFASARVYANSLDGYYSFGNIFPMAVNIYPAGTEAQSGPIQRLVIPPLARAGERRGYRAGSIGR